MDTTGLSDKKKKKKRTLTDRVAPGNICKLFIVFWMSWAHWMALRMVSFLVSYQPFNSLLIGGHMTIMASPTNLMMSPPYWLRLVTMPSI